MAKKATPKTKRAVKINPSRPPVVTLLGHVDHGKTSLISKIKEQDLTRKEFGGISQHTKAYQVEKKFDGQPRKITFIDTPGHAAFAAMRSRGGKIADLVILVVAADDGVQTQTKEAVAFAREANTPIMVALNKIDLKTADPDRVKKQLGELDLNPEDWGGKTTVVPVSATTGQGIDDLLEMILLWAETSELKADPQAPFEGVVIESHRDPRRGPMAVLLVKNGSLKAGQKIFTETASAKVKALFLEGKGIKVGEPSMPVEVLGFTAVPNVGEKVTATQPETAPEAPTTPTKPIRKKDDKVLNVILKADTVGTSQAVEAAVEAITLGNYKTQILGSGIGEITESDVRLAADSNAEIYAFNTGYSLGAEELSKDLGVKVEQHNIIYQLIKGVTDSLEEKKNAAEGLLPGSGEVIKVFVLPLSQDKIAGTRIVNGLIKVGQRVAISRKGEKLHEGRVKSIGLESKEVKKAEKGQEAGLYIRPQFDFKVGDLIEIIP